jgi:NAD(P)-dependent dehydrogenase (short-subunit alcohol dehydrogenase family)
MRKSILITGAGTGIGKDTAKMLLARGHTVYVTTFKEEEVAELQTEMGPHARVFKLDITNAKDREKVAALDLDVLINNAAQSLSGSLAEVSIDRVRRLFEVNDWLALASEEGNICGKRRGTDEVTPSSLDISAQCALTKDMNIALHFDMPALLNPVSQTIRVA